MEHNENISRMRQEIPSHSKFIHEVKEEKLYCQQCAVCDIDFARLKFHIFKEHPTGATVVANCIDETNYGLQDIRLFCVKETCSFSTTLCNVYEEHLMNCCLLHRNLSEKEKERMKSTFKFIFNFHNKHNLSPFTGFLNYVSTFNTTFTNEDGSDRIQINKDVECCNSSSENSISTFPTPVLLFTTQKTDFDSPIGEADNFENTSLPMGEQEKNKELTKSYPFNTTFTSKSKGESSLIVQSVDDRIAPESSAMKTCDGGSLIEFMSFKEETKKDRIKKENEMYYGYCCNKDQDDSTQQPEQFTRMTTGTQYVECDKSFVETTICIPGMGTDKGVKPFQDNGCANSFNGNDMLNQCVMEEEEGKRLFKCDECSSTFITKSHLTRHKRIHTGAKPFKCHECGKVFREISNLNQHIATHTGQKPFKCNECGQTFGLKGNLMKHIRTHTEHKLFKCNECGRAFHEKFNLIQHKRTHTGEKPFKCDECGKTFNRSSSLVQHSQIHTDDKPFICNECGKTFSRNNHLMQHIRTHTGEKPFECIKCGKAFRNFSNLIQHRKTHTDEKPFKCNECGKSFGQSGYLIKHIETHTGEKPFKCDECGMAFGRNDYLVRHRATHTGEKPFKCDECGKTFGQRSYLMKHNKTHSVDKSFKCNECGKTFTKNSYLIQHSKTHTGDKPFKCDECGKTFRRNSHLVRHKATHTGEKPFTCNECGKNFKDSSSIIQHIRTHTGERPYKCNECGKTFVQTGSLIKHSKAHSRKTLQI